LAQSAKREPEEIGMRVAAAANVLSRAGDQIQVQAVVDLQPSEEGRRADPSYGERSPNCRAERICPHRWQKTTLERGLDHPMPGRARLHADRVVCFINLDGIRQTGHIEQDAAVG
jgi:hypothetical protein